MEYAAKCEDYFAMRFAVDAAGGVLKPLVQNLASYAVNHFADDPVNHAAKQFVEQLLNIAEMYVAYDVVDYPGLELVLD